MVTRDELEAAQDWLLKRIVTLGNSESMPIMKYIHGDVYNRINLPARSIANYIAEYHAEKSKEERVKRA